MLILQILGPTSPFQTVSGPSFKIWKNIKNKRNFCWAGIMVWQIPARPLPFERARFLVSKTCLIIKIHRLAAKNSCLKVGILFILLHSG